MPGMANRPILATLCYVKKAGKTLMLHRIKKARDVHEGKWNGLGGKFEPGESPEECVIREMKEESGLDILDPVLKGTLTFPSFTDGADWYVFVFVASRFSGSLIDSPEGKLDWIEDERILHLPLWDGDRLFIPLLEKPGFFSGKLDYKNGRLVSHKLTSY
jgi:8-oxo-dGTP diphosphatase